MNVDFEGPMAALFAHLSAAAIINFTGDLTQGSAVVETGDALDALFPGLAVFGPGLPFGTLIDAVDPGAGTVTLTELASETVGAAELSTGFLTASRRLQHWQDAKAQPALFLRRTGTVDGADGDGLIMTMLECEAWIYSQSGKDPDVAPDIALSNLDRLVRESLLPDSEDGLFTLGGRVHWCRIEGRSDYSPGDQGAQGISRIPIRITLP